MEKIITYIVACCCFISSSLAQHHIGIGGGYNQSIFYCSQPKSTYYTLFRSHDSFLANINYKLNIPNKKENMRIGTQCEWKRQSAYFYYDDRRNNDTIPTGINYDIDVLHIYLFPELVVGNSIRFIFSGGPVFEYVLATKAKGVRIENKEKINIDEKNNGDISGAYIGAKINLGMEFPIYKNLYFVLQNSYSAGLSSKYGRLKRQMKYYNCLDINLSGSLFYHF